MLEKVKVGDYSKPQNSTDARIFHLQLVMKWKSCDQMQLQRSKENALEGKSGRLEHALEGKKWARKTCRNEI